MLFLTYLPTKLAKIILFANEWQLKSMQRTSFLPKCTFSGAKTTKASGGKRRRNQPKDN